jgi:hypothetical protein
MKTATSLYGCMAAALLFVLASAGIAAAGSDTCAGVFADIDSTCTPLVNTTSGSNNNSAFGTGALANTTGIDNTAVGAVALGLNTTGIDNTATGAFALQKNTGSSNTATGEDALEDNTMGATIPPPDRPLCKTTARAATIPPPGIKPSKAAQQLPTTRAAAIRQSGRPPC